MDAAKVGQGLGRGDLQRGRRGANIKGAAVVVGAVLVEVARGAATLERATIGKGIELGTALGALQDNIAKACGHLEATGIERAGALVADELVIADPHNDKSISTSHQILVAIAIVDARIDGGVGVDLAIGLTDGDTATDLLLASGEKKGKNQHGHYGRKGEQEDWRSGGLIHRNWILCGAERASSYRDVCHDQLLSSGAIVGIDGCEKDLGGDAEGATGDMGEVVADGMPMLEEARAAGILHNIHHGDVGKPVDIIVVVEDRVGVGILENFVVAEGRSDRPNLVGDTTRILTADLLLGKARGRGAHHVEKDAIESRIVGGMRVGAPILRALAPAVVDVVFGPFGATLVLDIEKDKVDGDIRAAGSHCAGHFHKHPHTAGAVVSPKERFVVVVLVAVVVGPHAAVPMGGKKDAFAGSCLGGGFDRSNNILAADNGAVPKRGGEVLHDDGVAPTLHLPREIGSTLSLRLGVWCAETES